jgi:putative transposase
MDDRKMIASDFIAQAYPKKTVLQVLGIARSSYYYQPKASAGKRGISKSEYTLTSGGELISNAQVIQDIREILGEEFVDYGYLKVTHWLRQEKDYIINPKKVYRLMGEQGLLNKACDKEKQKRNKRNWVKQLVPPAQTAFDYLEFDIKYFYVAGKSRNALLLSVIDVKTRWVLGHFMAWDIKQQQVIDLFDQIFEVYPLPKSFYVRNDNGSQFIAEKVQLYFQAKGVTQEFCKPATPEQNAHIESYHSIQEKIICQQYEFDDLKQITDTLNRFIDFYNFRRIHSGVAYQAPFKFLLSLGIDMNQFDLEKVLDAADLDLFSFS